MDEYSLDALIGAIKEEREDRHECQLNTNLLDGINGQPWHTDGDY